MAVSPVAIDPIINIHHRRSSLDDDETFSGRLSRSQTRWRTGDIQTVRPSLAFLVSRSRTSKYRTESSCRKRDEEKRIVGERESFY
jgi:hypothetical protein